jgi:hypothetical protein
VFAENEFDDDENVVRLRNVSTSKTRARVLRSYSTFFSAVSRLEMVGTFARLGHVALEDGDRLVERHGRGLGETRAVWTDENGERRFKRRLCAVRDTVLAQVFGAPQASFIQSRHSTSSVGGVH